jgi:leucyl aminopeptidase
MLACDCHPGIFMRYCLQQARPKDISTDCAIVGLYEEKMLTSACAEVDEACGGLVKALIDSGDLTGKLGQTHMLHKLPGLNAQRVLVVGLGDQRKFDAQKFAKVQKDVHGALKSLPGNSAVSYLVEVEVPGKDAAWKLAQSVTLADHVHYRYQHTLKNKGDQKLEEVQFTAPGALAEVLARAQAVASGVKLTRELGNLPPNICTPEFLAEQASALAKRHDGLVQTEILDVPKMQELGMGALLAVGQGSANPPRLIVMRYSGDGDSKPYVFVGKGVTFDTGGVNIKPSPGMEEMKFDMCGAASVFGVMEAIALSKPKLNVVCVAPAAENMCDGAAYRPSDVIRTMAGHTVEILNTDAEGRLILCDALTYARKFSPHTIIDIATLTGACVVALGNVATGLLSKHDDLANELLAAGEATLDRAWRLPLWDDYQSQLDTGFADFANIGGKGGGAITAACFLSRFTEGLRWAHLDIAGTSNDTGRKGYATGRPVQMLLHWLLAQES